MGTKEFIEQLIENEKSMQLTVGIYVVADDETMENISLCDILGLDKSRINESGQKIIDILEQDEDSPKELYCSLKWKILALLTVQDAFRGIVHAKGRDNSLFYKSYFYYESLHLLREYFYCGFNNFQIASQHLLRTILEFSIKQNYFDDLCMKQGSFTPLEKYLADGISPKPEKMISTFLPKTELTKPLKKQVRTIYGGLSNSSSHAYMPTHSVRSNGKLQHEYSIDSMFFWATLSPVLDSILWMYYFYFPQLFNPKDVARKFGFSPPVGCFITEKQHIAIRESLKPRDFKMFMDFASGTDEVQSLNDFYNSQEDLTDQQIMATSDEEDEGKPPTSIEAGYYRAVVQIRASQEVMANQCAVEAAKMYAKRKDTEEIFANIGQYEWWQKNYKKVR
jgi:hypothetical protein